MVNGNATIIGQENIEKPDGLVADTISELGILEQVSQKPDLLNPDGFNTRFELAAEVDEVFDRLVNYVEKTWEPK